MMQKENTPSNVTLSLADESTTTANQNLEIILKNHQHLKQMIDPETKTETGKGNLSENLVQVWRIL